MIMKKMIFVSLLVVLSAGLAGGAEAVLVEAEGFDDLGGWVIDQQFMDRMGSPYVLAHGLGVPVADASTVVRNLKPGTYRIWVRTRNWVAPWNAPGAPGKFTVLIDGRALPAVFGTEGAEWHWQDGGTIEMAKSQLTIALHDLTGFEGRCDAILLTRDLQTSPPERTAGVARFTEPVTVKKFDLVVVGGGVAGTCASLSAARLGLKVALIQDRPVLGGNNSSEVRVHLGGRTNFEPYPRIGDIVREIGPRQDKGNRAASVYFEDNRKLEAVLAEKNIELYLNTHACGVEKKAGSIVAVLAKDIRTAKEYRFSAPLFADCTGDGTIGYLAGADFDMTSKGHMGASNQWRVVDTGKPQSFPRCPWAIDLSERPFPGRGRADGYKKLGDWDWESGFYYDPIEKAEYIRDLNFRAMYGAWDALKNIDKVYPNYKIEWAAYVAGKRESRRLMGDVVLSKEDLITNKEYTDGCVPTSWDMDLHLPARQYQAGPGKDAFIAQDYHTKYKRPYWVPYRCLYSRNIPNLFMAGRDISVTHEALGSVRVMRTCGMMGEVVGMAASVCRKYKITPREVYSKYLDELKGLMRTGVGVKEKPHKLVLFDFDGHAEANRIEPVNAKVHISDAGTLLVEAEPDREYPGVNLKPRTALWDLSDYSQVAVDVKNPGTRPARVYLRLDNEYPNMWNTNLQAVMVEPGEKKTLSTYLMLGPWKFNKPIKLIGLRGGPGDADKIDPAKVTQVCVFVDASTSQQRIELDNVTAAGRFRMLNADTFIPFIDKYGQFKHSDWPGKCHSEADMQVRRAEEQTELSAKPGPEDWDKFGGWKTGPELGSSGFFTVAKYKGKWWLVDPEGHLFWSQGIDCVRSGNATPISDRENYFDWLGKKDSPFAEFYGTASWAPHGYYKDHSPYRTFDFSRANLLRKYGPDWQRRFADVTHSRLRSWGINTIANWSDEHIYLLRRTPYVATISFDARRLEGSEGYWGKFYDVFDDSFRANLSKRLEQEKGKSISDAWCIGFFVHNELAWGDETSLSLAALASPADQPAKKVFIEDLKAKYGTIDKLNDAWAVKYKGWDDILQSRQLPRNKDKWAKSRGYADLTAFYTKTAETYFATVREQVKRAAPQQLYLGCRFAWVNDYAARAAAKYCDVVCYNRYDYGVENLALPGEIDKPIIIGEFHFGALDRGLFHPGLKRTANQQDRANAYSNYVRGALRNRYIVGTHWFQYKDQATTGRGDGEDYQIGFIDIADTAYPEIVEAARRVGQSMYIYRLGN